MKIKKGGIFAAAVILSGCGDRATGPDGSPPFENVSLSSPLYVAYFSPDPSSKPDTVTLSFHYNSLKVKSIVIQATLDSGKTWLTISTFAPDGSNRATVAWVPKADTLHFNYFGFKEGSLRISDTVSNISIASTKFLVLGALPFVLSSPVGGETFHGTDSIRILYSQNQDLTANITVCAKTEDKSDWAQNIGTKLLLSKTLPIKNFLTIVAPQDLAADTAHINLSQPLIILLADYGPNGKRILSGPITIIQ